MKIDLSLYEVQRIPVKNWYRKSADRNLSISFMVSMWAATNQCPAILVAFLLAEEIGFTPDIIRIIDILIKCYQYDEILGQSDESPYLTLDTRRAIKNQEE